MYNNADTLKCAAGQQLSFDWDLPGYEVGLHVPELAGPEAEDSDPFGIQAVEAEFATNGTRFGSRRRLFSVDDVTTGCFVVVRASAGQDEDYVFELGDTKVPLWLGKVVAPPGFPCAFPMGSHWRSLWVPIGTDVATCVPAFDHCVCTRRHQGPVVARQGSRSPWVPIGVPPGFPCTFPVGSLRGSPWVPIGTDVATCVPTFDQCVCT